MHGATELASVTKQWMGVGKVLLNSAGNDVLSIAPAVIVSTPCVC